MLLRLGLSSAALVSTAFAAAGAEEARQLEFCQLAERAAAHEGQSVVLTARIVHVGPEGWIVEDGNCPERFLIAFPVTDPEKRVLKAFSEASNRPGVEPRKIATIRANVVMREWQMPLTNITRVRPMLEVTDVIGWVPEQ